MSDLIEIKPEIYPNGVMVRDIPRLVAESYRTTQPTGKPLTGRILGRTRLAKEPQQDGEESYIPLSEDEWALLRSLHSSANEVMPHNEMCMLCDTFRDSPDKPSWSIVSVDEGGDPQAFELKEAEVGEQLRIVDAVMKGLLSVHTDKFAPIKHVREWTDLYIAYVDVEDLNKFLSRIGRVMLTSESQPHKKRNAWNDGALKKLLGESKVPGMTHEKLANNYGVSRQFIGRTLEKAELKFGKKKTTQQKANYASVMVIDGKRPRS